MGFFADIVERIREKGDQGARLHESGKALPNGPVGEVPASEVEGPLVMHDRLGRGRVLMVQEGHGFSILHIRFDHGHDRVRRIRSDSDELRWL